MARFCARNVRLQLQLVPHFFAGPSNTERRVSPEILSFFASKCDKPSWNIMEYKTEMLQTGSFAGTSTDDLTGDTDVHISA